MNTTALVVLIAALTITIFYAAIRHNVALIVAASIAGAAHFGVLFGSEFLGLGPQTSTTAPAVSPDPDPLPPVLPLDPDPPTKTATSSTDEPETELDYTPPKLPEVPSLTTNPPISQRLQPPPPPARPADGTQNIIPPAGAAGSEMKFKTYDRADLQRQPEPTFRTEPVYPYDLKRQGITGSVVLQFIVDTHGAVHDIRVVRSSHPGFERPAVEALLKWRFRPGRKDGRTVNTRNVQQEITFSLNGS